MIMSVQAIQSNALDCVCGRFGNESSRSLGALPFYSGCLCKEEARRASDSTLLEGQPACTQPRAGND